MDRTKTKLATFFNNDDDDQPSAPQKAVDDQKLSQYTQGTVRKSKREKEREREEAKKREEEELAAKTYAEFLDAFEGDGAKKKGGFVRAGGERAEYSLAPRGRGRKNEGMRAFEDDDLTRPASPGPPPPPKPKGKRAMDHFLEEIKREQAEREARLARSSRAQGRSVTALAAYEGQSGSKDRGDPLTSNVFVANLPSNVNEAALGNFFAQRCGPVGSVKIMWPRGDVSHGPGADMNVSRARRAGGLSGFVSFMKRKDAETAVREMDGFDWGGSVLRVGWSKAVPMASRPLYAAYPASGSRSRSRSGDRPRRRSRSYSRDRYRSRSHSRSRGYKRARSYSRSRSPSRTRRYRRSRSHSRSRSRSRSYGRSRGRYSRSRSRNWSRDRRRSLSPMGYGRTGVDADTEKFIRTVALKVRDNGEKFEGVLRERERENTKFRFLFDASTPENRLYRALVNGETLVEGFDDDGYNSVYSTDSAEESERERGRRNRLGRLARRRFEAMLRALTGKRGELARCMAFSLEHAEAASEISDIIVASLLVDGTPVPRKVARLHLICDILHNSAAAIPSAWKFRQEFQARLGIVFDHLSSIYHSFPGRITAETFKKQITAVLDIWEDWIVFPPEYIETLKSRLDGSTARKDSRDGDENAEREKFETRDEGQIFATKFKPSSFKPAEVVPAVTVTSKPPAPGDDEGEADMDMEDSDAEEKPKEKPVTDNDVDGVPIGDVDGEPIDGEPIDGETIDGEPLELDGEPIDGEPLDGGIDGGPIAEDDIDGVPI